MPIPAIRAGTSLKQPRDPDHHESRRAAPGGSRQATLKAAVRGDTDRLEQDDEYLAGFVDGMSEGEPWREET